MMVTGSPARSAWALERLTLTGRPFLPIRGSVRQARKEAAATIAVTPGCVVAVRFVIFSGLLVHLFLDS
jgi:hypothetical protein